MAIPRTLILNPKPSYANSGPGSSAPQKAAIIAALALRAHSWNEGTTSPGEFQWALQASTRDLLFIGADMILNGGLGFGQSSYTP